MSTVAQHLEKSAELRQRGLARTPGGVHSNVRLGAPTSSSFHVSFGSEDLTDYRGYADLASVLVEHGIWVAARGIWYVSAAHSHVELDAALSRFEAALKRCEPSRSAAGPDVELSSQGPRWWCRGSGPGPVGTGRRSGRGELRCADR